MSIRGDESADSASKIATVTLTGPPPPLDSWNSKQLCLRLHLRERV